MSSNFHRSSAFIGGLAMCGLALTSGEAMGVMQARDGLDYFAQRMGEEYPAVVKQYAFTTSLSFETEDVAGDEQVIAGTLGTIITSEFAGLSTATLVGSQYVMATAASVLPYGWFQYEIGGEIYRGEQWWIPGDYDQDETIDAHDIAIIRLDREVDNVDPLGWADLSIDSLNNSGEEFTLVGFAAPGTDGDTFTGGARRAVENRFDVDDANSGGTLDQDLHLLYDLDLHPSQTTVFPADYDPEEDYPLTFEGIATVGDGGGPLIIGDEVVGISSYTYNDEDGKLYGAATDIRRFSTWIDAIVNDHDLSNEPGFGWETGLAGIEIEEFRADEDREDRTLVPYLIAQGVIDYSDGFGTSPFFPNYDYDSGLLPSDYAAAQALFASFLASSGFAAPDESTEDIFAALALSFNQQFPDNTQPNGLTHPWLFGENGIFGDGSAAAGVTPEDFFAGLADLFPDGFNPEDGWMAGDIDKDGDVDEFDLAKLLDHWREETTDPAEGNLTMDDVMFELVGEEDVATGGVVNEFDLAILLDHWTGSTLTEADLYNAFIAAGKTPPSGLIPEPGTVALLGMASLAMLGRRRRSA